MSTICHIPVKGIDDQIAAKVTNWDPYRVATLRGMYDESHASPLDTSNIDEATKQLVSYRRDLAKANAVSINKVSSNLASTFKKTKEEFSAEERFNRVNMIATLFSDRLDAIQEANPSLPRKAICNGFISNGKNVAGQFSVFEGVYDDILDEYSNSVAEGNTEDATKFKKVLDNWASLVTFARIRLRDTEELKLGNNIEYADDANPDNYNDNKLADLFNAENSTREAWQETSDMKSSFGTVGKQVRKLIGNINKVEKGEIVYDDLGYPEMLDPVKVHQSLLTILRGTMSEAMMMRKLSKASINQSWIEPIIEALKADDQLKTQFFVDFKKNFQLYSMLLESVDKGLKTFKTKILNKTDKSSIKQYLTNITLGKVLNTANSLYNKEGKVDWKNIKQFRDKVDKYFNTSSNTSKEGVFGKLTTYNSVNTPRFYTRGIPREEQKNTLASLLNSIGIDIDDNTLSRILSNGRDLHTITNNLKELVKYGFDSYLTKDELDKLNAGNFSDLESITFKQFYNAKEAKVKEKINKIINIITQNREGLRLESQVRYKDKNGNSVTLFSEVIPSYLGDKLDKIQSFIEDNNTEGLKKMLQDEYFDSSYFMDNGVILNKWLEELYNSTTDADSFASMFKFKRFLGTQDNNFENFTSKQHAIDMFAEYFSEKQISKNSKYAWYPVFILGDSGVSKYIRAKRYNENEILDGLYNVYRQERRRMEQTKATNAKLTNENYSKIENFSSKEDIYTILPFLNKDYVANDKTVGKYAITNNPTEQEVKNAIQSYMTDAVASFKNSINNLGLLEQNDKSKTYTYFNQEVNNNSSIDDVLKDFYWNVKFATIQQIQMFTIDNAFYNGTKDLQKRYKEIHAPGYVVSTEAKDKEGNLYSDNGIERAVYFNDINVDASKTNPEFMKAIANYFGENSDIYKTYKENTLTDGQGYRTLDSYRKVMGMAGRWTEDMQKAFESIKSIRSRYGEEDTIPSDELSEIAKLAVVFQPIKPYMFTIENFPLNNNEVLKIPIQHKYAEAILIPELLPAGSKLRHIAYWMENSNIDLLGSTKMVKVGVFGSTDISKASTREELNNSLNKGYVHQLNYSDYRIQTNIPEHVNSSQLFGTQVRKLIMANIKLNDYHYESYVNNNKVNLGGQYGMVRMNGRNLVSFYNSLIVSNILKSYDKFANSVSNITDISDRLLQSTVSNSRELIDNMLAYSLTGAKDFTIPLFEGGLEHDSSAMLLSIFKKLVNKQAIKGGSAVQVSAMGIKGYDEDGDLKYVADPNNPNNIKYVECEIPFDLKFTDVNGAAHSLNFEDWCNSDGTLKLEKEEDTSGNYLSYKGEDGKYHRPLIEAKYPNILSILAYRIPTERDYSMINLRIKRFSQKTAGGTIKVPPQGTTIAGFDFDIDKLYFMRYEFRAKPLTKELKEKIWKDFYNDNPQVKRTLLNAREENQNVQGLISELFSQFTNSELAKNIANTEEGNNSLYKYWKAAGLEGSPKDALNKYFSENIGKYNLEFDNYDYSKPPMSYNDEKGNTIEGNSRVARNNMLISLIQSRLSDYETFEERYTPGGFKGASKAARILRELLFGNLSTVINKGKVDFKSLEERTKDKSTDPEPNYDPSDPMTMIIYNQQNQVAGKLIGIFANQNTNHAFASLMESFNLKESLAFGSHPNGLSDFLHKGNSKEVDLNLAELLAASADAVKDPVLNFLNFNTITAGAGAMLSRLGYSTTDIGLLFNQPIIKEICDYAFNNNVDVSLALKEITKNYTTEGVDIPEVNPATDLSSNTLAINIANSRVLKERGENAMNNTAFRTGQLHVAKLFSDILRDSTDISNFISVSKFTASNAVGSTFGDLYSQQMKVQKYIKSFVEKNGKTGLNAVMKVTSNIDLPINNNDDIFDSHQSYLEKLIPNPFAYEQAMFDTNRLAKKLLSVYYPYNTSTYENIRGTLASLTKSGTLDAATINSIHSDTLAYILAQQEDSIFNGSHLIQTSLGEMSTRDYYTKYFAKILYNSLEENPDIKNLPIFKYMQFPIDEKTDTVSMNIQGIGGLASYKKDELMDSWADLNTSSPDLARDLFMYNYYKNGFGFGPSSFMNLAPTEVKLGIKVGYSYSNGKWKDRSYIDFLHGIKDDKIKIDTHNFAMQYILNHLDNRRLVFTPKGSTLKYLKSLSHIAGVAQSSFILDISSMKEDAEIYTISNDNIDSKHQAFRPCIVIDDIAYIASDPLDQSNISSDGTMRYVKVNKLGTSNVSLQYNSSNQLAENNSKVSLESSDTTKGNTNVVPEEIVNTPTFNREEVINEIAEEMTKSYIASEQAMPEEAESLANNLKAALSAESDSNLQQCIKSIREAERKDGIVVLDEEGNPKKGC